MKVPHIASVMMTLAISVSSPALAAPTTSVPYDVRHTFNTRLIGNQVYRGAWQWFDHAIAASTVAAIDDKTKQGSAPFIPAAAGLMTQPATSGTANADANSQFQANADGTGFSRVFGGGVLGANGTRVASEASTVVALNRGVTNRNGSITWSPNWQYITAATGRLGDPIDVTYLNLDDSTTVSSSLFNLDLDFGQDGSSSYNNGDLTISGPDGRFTLIMDSPFITSGRGTMSLVFLNGIVTQSVATGIFSGLLPAVGSSSSAIAFHLGDASGSFNIDFDFGSVPGNVLGYEFQAKFGTSASTAAVGLPEPKSWLMMAVGCILLIARKRAYLHS